MDLAEIRKKAQRERAAKVIIPIEPDIVTEREQQPFTEPESLQPVLTEPSAFTDYDLAARLELEALLEEEERLRTLAPEPQEVRDLVFSTPESHDPRLPEPSATVPVQATSMEQLKVEQQPPSEERRPAVYDPLSLILSGRMAAGIYDDADVPVEIEVETGDRDQFLCFWLGDEEYAINIMEIKEIVKPREVTEVPRAPVFVPGIVSLRGVVIPVYDMHLRLGLAKNPETGKERIIVVKKGEEFCGLMVDRVSKVVKLTKSMIEQPPVVLDGIDREFVEGLGRYDGGMFILLDLERVLDITLLKG